MSALTVAVLGMGHWAEGPDVPAPDGKPQTTLLPPAERRRAPATVSLALSVAEQACHQAGVPPQCLRSVFASAHGDLEITDYLCRTLAESPEHLSPTKFHHSVHNAASGYWTIGVGNMQASTAISAGQHSFAQGLLEAATQAVCEQAPVLLVAYDMPAPAPLVPITGSTALVGLALVLAPQALVAASEAPATLMTLSLQTAPMLDATDDGAAELMGRRSPMAVGLPLLKSLSAIEVHPHAPADCCLWLSPAQALVIGLNRKASGPR